MHAFAITGPAPPGEPSPAPDGPATGTGRATHRRPDAPPTGADLARSHPRCAHHLGGDRLGL
jgi:hypothetical protein